jgi:hypothetical protein
MLDDTDNVYAVAGNYVDETFNLNLPDTRQQRQIIYHRKLLVAVEWLHPLQFSWNGKETRMSLLACGLNA